MSWNITLSPLRNRCPEMPLVGVSGHHSKTPEQPYTSWGTGFPCGLNGSRYLDIGSGHKLLASTFIGLFWGAMDKASERLDAAIFAILERKKDLGPLLNLEEEFDRILRKHESVIIEAVRNKRASGAENFFELARVARLASANKVSRVVSTHLGKAWEEMAALSHLAMDPESTLNRRIEGVDIVFLEREELRHTQIKTQKNTLTGSQTKRSVIELSMHPYPLFAAAFDVANWTFPPPRTSKIERIAGQPFWEGKLEISYELVFAKARETAQRLESVLFG